MKQDKRKKFKVKCKKVMTKNAGRKSQNSKIY